MNELRQAVYMDSGAGGVGPIRGDSMGTPSHVEDGE